MNIWSHLSCLASVCEFHCLWAVALHSLGTTGHTSEVLPAQRVYNSVIVGEQKCTDFWEWILPDVWKHQFTCVTKAFSAAGTAASTVGKPNSNLSIKHFFFDIPGKRSEWSVGSKDWSYSYCHASLVWDLMFIMPGFV